MTEAPLISIGMSVFNGEKTLAAAIESILRQTWDNWELIVIDDGSTDDTLKLLCSYADARIRIYSDGKNRGLAARINEAVKLARGSYFARMDADDIAYPQRLQSQLAYLQAHPDVDLVGAWALVFDSAGGVTGVRRTPEKHVGICASFCSGFALMHPTFMGHRSWFERFTYDESLPRAQDQALLAQAFGKSLFANVPQVLLGYREDIPALGTLFGSRLALMRGMGGAYLRQHRVMWALRTLLTQCLKMATDMVLATPGMRRYQLARRSSAATPEERDAWLELNRCLARHPTGQDGVHG